MTRILILSLIVFISALFLAKVESRREFTDFENFMRQQRASYKRRHDAENQKEYLKQSMNAIKGIKDPYEEHKPTKHLKVPDETPSQLLWEYARPFIGFEVLFFMILPILFGKILFHILAKFRPIVKRARQPFVEPPQVPLLFLQGTKEEIHLKGPKRNEMWWLCTEFLVLGNDPDITINFLHYSLCQPKQPLEDDRWKFVKYVSKARIWNFKTQQRRAAGLPPDRSFITSRVEARDSKESRESKMSYYDEYDQD